MELFVKRSVSDVPTRKNTITYKLNGGKLGGKTGSISEKYTDGTVIELPKPERKGYTFDYWKGSRYKADNPDNSESDDSKHTDSKDNTDISNKVRTGDDALLYLWMSTFIVAAILATVIGALIKRRKTDTGE